jgi:hypothetical protein
MAKGVIDAEAIENRAEPLASTFDRVSRRHVEGGTQ